MSKYCWTRLNKESEKQISFLILEHRDNCFPQFFEIFANFDRLRLSTYFVNVETLDKVEQREREADFFFDIGSFEHRDNCFPQFFEIFANFDRLRLSTCFDKFLRQEKNFLVKSRGIREFYEKFAQWQKGNENILRILRIFRFS